MFVNQGRFWGVRIPTDNGPKYRIGKENAGRVPFEQIEGAEVSDLVSILADLRLEHESDTLYSPDDRPEPENFLFEFEKALNLGRFMAEFRSKVKNYDSVGVNVLAGMLDISQPTLGRWVNTYILPPDHECPDYSREGYNFGQKTAKQIKILHTLRNDLGVSMQAINERDRNKIFHQIIGVDTQRVVPVHE